MLAEILMLVLMFASGFSTMGWTVIGITVVGILLGAVVSVKDELAGKMIILGGNLLIMFCNIYFTYLLINVLR